jgi:hypothetical protein
MLTVTVPPLGMVVFKKQAKDAPPHAPENRR